MYTARVVQQFMNENEIEVLTALACKLTRFESHRACLGMDEMERRLRRLPHQPSNLQELAGDLVNIWNDIPQNFHANVVASMRRRCTVIVNAEGGHTQYWHCDSQI